MWLNHLVQDVYIGLFCLKFISNAIHGILVLSTRCVWTECSGYSWKKSQGLTSFGFHVVVLKKIPLFRDVMLCWISVVWSSSGLSGPRRGLWLLQMSETTCQMANCHIFSRASDFALFSGNFTSDWSPSMFTCSLKIFMYSAVVLLFSPVRIRARALYIGISLKCIYRLLFCVI